MSFNPAEHIIKLPHRNKKTGKIEYRDYLEVKWRIVWFRDDHPNGRITSELVSASDGVIVFKAVIAIEEGLILATGYGTAPTEGQGVWTGRAFEKAETAAIGRALAHAGFGTQFTGEDEEDHLADSPIESHQKQSDPNDQPMQEPGPEPVEKEAILETVTQKIDSSGQQFWGFVTREGEKVSEWSDKLFSKAGYMERGDWQEANRKKLEPPIPCRIRTQNGYWHVVPNSIPPYNPKWSELGKKDIPL